MSRPAAIGPGPVSLLVTALVVASIVGARAQDGVGDLSRHLQTLGARVGPAVVQVLTSGYAVGPAAGQAGAALVSPQRGAGSGVVLDPGGYIVTNAHVVEGASRVRVQLTSRAEGQSVLGRRGAIVPAQVVGVDRETDLAVLRVRVDEPLPFLELGDSEALRPGQLVMAFGSPLGLANSISLGVVSASARQMRPEDPMIYIQTDASINPGNSGGPLVDADGRVVGISTFIISQSGGSDGIGFAAPSNIVGSVYRQIRQFGRVRRGELGLRAQTITPELSRGLALGREHGVVIADVYPGGPAEAAGLQIGDVVLTLDGKPMENARQLQVNIYARSVGEQVRLEVLRGATPLALDVTPVERPGDHTYLEALVDPDEHLVRRLGLLGLNLTPDIAALLPTLRRGQGVVVAAVSAGGGAFEDDVLMSGDVIHALNRQPIGGVRALRDAVDALPEGGVAVLQIERQGELRYVVSVLD